MEIKTVWLALSRRHRGSLVGIFILILLLSLILLSALTVWQNAGKYVQDEMERLGFGEITAWVSGVPDMEKLAGEVTALPETDSIGVQSLIFSEYEINGQKSDSEGQLITYEPEKYPYRIFTDNLAEYQTGNAEIGAGEMYVPPSMQSMFDVKIGDEIHFRVARNSVTKSFTVKGWFEDPFMGSSMIGMKGFLVCGQDHDEMAGMIREAGMDGLARDGYMLHIFQSSPGNLTAAELNAVLNEKAGLSNYAEFTHSDSAISGFMLTLQNVFTGLFLAFSLILVLVSLVVLGHSISSFMEQDMTDTGILKTMGFTTGKLQKIQMLLFLSPVLCGMVVGVFAAFPVAKIVSSMTLTTTGLLFPAGVPFNICLPVLLAVLLLLAGFIYLETAQIEKVTPMSAIRREEKHKTSVWHCRNGKAVSGWHMKQTFPIAGNGLGVLLALRQLATGRMRYVSAGLVSMLLVFFISLIGRIDSWLGPNGEGLMDAFNPSDLHIAAQPMGETKNEDVERLIRSYTDITDQYMLAMPGVAIEGVDYTANVITEPERFHMLEGTSCLAENEIVLTEFVAADLNVKIGDTVSVRGELGSFEYKVSGIYQCANDMGVNVGLSRAGYQKIGKERENMWCVHYFLKDASQQPVVMQALDETYGGDVYLHENAWPGLYGILSAMGLLMYFMYGIAAAVMFIVIALAGSRLIGMEQKDMGIYRTLGFTATRLRISFVLRFGIVSMMGALTGIVFSVWFTDLFVAALLRMFGISNFTSHLAVSNTLFPAVAVIGLSVAFSWMVSRKIKKGRLSSLIAE